MEYQDDKETGKTYIRAKLVEEQQLLNDVA
jgi:hypothetical protein